MILIAPHYDYGSRGMATLAQISPDRAHFEAILGTLTADLIAE